MGKVTGPLSAVELLYRTLPLRPWQTRLLRIHKGLDDTPIFGDLVVADITFLDGAVLHKDQEQVGYKALSYTWGTGTSSESIIVNGVALPIKENLLSFLQQHRQQHNNEIGYDVFLWIDAICINQYDAREKSQQVFSMVTFYEHAKEVIVWLGKAGANTDAAMSFLHQSFEGKTNAEPTNTVFQALCDLYSRPWPMRIWVKQEVWAAKDVSVQCGRHSVSWDVFVEPTGHDVGTEQNIGNHRAVQSKMSSETQEKWFKDLDTEATHVKAVRRLKRPPKPVTKLVHFNAVQQTTSGQRTKQDILYLLQDGRYCESTDIRDRIYALLGMCTDQDINIDYSASPEDVFTSLARHLIDREARVGIVLALDSNFGPQGDLALPSWVPDWRTIADDALDHGSWRLALHPARDILGAKLELEIIVPLPKECRGPSSKQWRNTHRSFDPKARDTLHLRGYVIATLPAGVEDMDLNELRLSWNPIKMHSDNVKFQSWQQRVKDAMLATINGTLDTNLKSSDALKKLKIDYDDHRDSKRWSDTLRLLGYPSRKHLPEHIENSCATMTDLKDLGDVALKISLVRDVALQAGDLLVVCHGCNLPVIIRPMEEINAPHQRYTYVGVAQCHEVYRLSHQDDKTEPPSLDVELRIFLHAREGLGGVETFAVV